MTTACFIINYNRLTLPSRMADYLASCHDMRPIFVDNNSDYEPLLEYYLETPYEVCRLEFNYGSAAPFHPVPAVLDRYGETEYFVVTDPDLIIDHIPKDWLGVLREGLDRYDWACKSGFSLRIFDLPDTTVGNMARKHEAGAWHNPMPCGKYYSAFIDTTFCLLRKNYHDFPAVRSAPPYCAIHKPWYYTCRAEIPVDELAYMENATARGSTYWTGKILDMVGPA